MGITPTPLTGSGWLTGMPLFRRINTTSLLFLLFLALSFQVHSGIADQGGWTGHRGTKPSGSTFLKRLMRFNKRVQMAHFVPVVKRDEYMFPDFEDIDNPALSSSFGWK